MFASVVILGVGAMVWYFMRVTPIEQLAGYQAQGAHTLPKEKTSFLDDMKLLIPNHIYLVFLRYHFYEIIVTIFDFYLKYLHL